MKSSLALGKFSGLVAIHSATAVLLVSCASRPSNTGESSRGPASYTRPEVLARPPRQSVLPQHQGGQRSPQDPRRPGGHRDMRVDDEASMHAQIQNRPGTPAAPPARTNTGAPGSGNSGSAGNPPSTAPLGSAPPPSAPTPPAEQPVAAGCSGVTMPIGNRNWTYDEMLFGLQANIGDWAIRPVFQIDFNNDPARIGGIVGAQLASVRGSHYEYALRTSEAYSRVVSFVNRQVPPVAGELPMDTALRDGKLAWLVAMMVQAGKNGECVRHIQAKAVEVFRREGGHADPRIAMVAALPFQTGADLVREGKIVEAFRELEQARQVRHDRRSELSELITQEKESQREERAHLVIDFDAQASVLIAYLNEVDGCRKGSGLGGEPRRNRVLERLQDARAGFDRVETPKNPRYNFGTLKGRVLACQSSLKREIAKLEADHKITTAKLEALRRRDDSGSQRRAAIDGTREQQLEDKLERLNEKIGIYKGYLTLVEGEDPTSLSSQLAELQAIHGELRRVQNRPAQTESERELQRLDEADRADSDKLLTYGVLGGFRGR